MSGLAERTAPNPDSPEGRLDRMETIMRANGMHEPTCGYVTSTRCDVPGCLVYHVPKACDCWLSKEGE